MGIHFYKRVTPLHWLQIKQRRISLEEQITP